MEKNSFQPTSNINETNNPQLELLQQLLAKQKALKEEIKRTKTTKKYNKK